MDKFIIKNYNIKDNVIDMDTIETIRLIIYISDSDDVEYFKQMLEQNDEELILNMRHFFYKGCVLCIQHLHEKKYNFNIINQDEDLVEHLCKENYDGIIDILIQNDLLEQDYVKNKTNEIIEQKLGNIILNKKLKEDLNNNKSSDKKLKI